MNKYQLEKLATVNLILNKLYIELIEAKNRKLEDVDIDDYEFNITETYNDFLSLEATYEIVYQNIVIDVIFKLDDKVFVDIHNVEFRTYELIYTDCFITDVKLIQKQKY